MLRAPGLPGSDLARPAGQPDMPSSRDHGRGSRGQPQLPPKFWIENLSASLRASTAGRRQLRRLAVASPSGPTTIASRKAISCTGRSSAEMTLRAKERRDRDEAQRVDAIRAGGLINRCRRTLSRPSGILIEAQFLQRKPA